MAHWQAGATDCRRDPEVLPDPMNRVYILKEDDIS